MATQPTSEIKNSKSSTAKAVKPRATSHTSDHAPQNSSPTLIDATLSNPSAVPMGLAQLQRVAGNRAVQRLLKQHQVQAKLTVGAANDNYEHEADQVASQVMRASLTVTPQNQTQPQTNLEDEGRVQRSTLASSISSVRPSPAESHADVQKSEQAPAAPGAGFQASGQLEQRLTAQQGGGRPLADDTRSFMENRFGSDFGSVRIHTGSESNQLNRSLSAQAFTHGRDIYFDHGKYNPNSAGGKSLLAHELTHVVQQGATKPNRVQTKFNTNRIQRALTVGGAYAEENPNFNEDDEESTEPEFNLVPDDNQRARDLNNPDYRYVMGTNTSEAKKITDADDAWRKVRAAKPAIDAMSSKDKKQMKARLKKWISRDEEVKARSIWQIIKVGLGKRSEDRRYKSWADVGTALIGEQKARPNKQKEQKLAAKVSKNADLRRDLAVVLQKIAGKIPSVATQLATTTPDLWQTLERPPSLKFGYWYPKGNVRTRMTNPALNRVSSNFVIIHEVMFTLGRRGFNIFGGPAKQGHVHGRGSAPETGEVGAASFEKGGQHALIETHPFVAAARERNLPLGAGASNTTHALMNFASLLSLSGRNKEAIAWAAFVFWNKKFKQVQAVRHTFHEIMDVASLGTGGEVAYDPDAANVYKTGYNVKGRRAPEPDNMTEEDTQESVSEMGDKGAVSPEQVIDDMLPKGPISGGSGEKEKVPEEPTSNLSEEEAEVLNQLAPYKGMGDLFNYNDLVGAGLGLHDIKQLSPTAFAELAKYIGVTESELRVQLDMSPPIPTGPKPKPKPKRLKKPAIQSSKSLMTYMKPDDTIPQPITDPSHVLRHMPDEANDGWSKIQTPEMWLLAKTAELNDFLGL